MSPTLIVGAVIVLLAVVIIARTVNIIQQDYVGIVKRVGEFHSVRQPGLTFLLPLVDSMGLVDTRETPRTDDKQEDITRNDLTLSDKPTSLSQRAAAKPAISTARNHPL